MGFKEFASLGFRGLSVEAGCSGPSSEPTWEALNSVPFIREHYALDPLRGFRV